MDWLAELFSDFDPASDTAQQAEAARTEQARIRTILTQQEAPRCSKCGGTGRLPQYLHRDHGTCYRCGGTGN